MSSRDNLFTRLAEMGFDIERIDRAMDRAMGDCLCLEELVNSLLTNDDDEPKGSTSGVGNNRVRRPPPQIVRRPFAPNPHDIPAPSSGSAKPEPPKPGGRESGDACNPDDNDDDNDVVECPMEDYYDDEEDMGDESAGTGKTMGITEQDLTNFSGYICINCLTKLKNLNDMKMHRIRTGHEYYDGIEDDVDVESLTEDEKLLKKKRDFTKRAEDLIKQRRKDREAKEQQEALEKEKIRRKTGQEITSAKQKFEEEEMKRLADFNKKEKLEAKLARQCVLADIERDKQARREKYSDAGAAAATAPAPIAPAAQVEPAEKRNYNECNIQIRLTNGKTLVQTFSPNEQLAAVRLYVELNRTDEQGPFTLMTNFPRRVFTSDEMELTLRALDLVPSTVIIVKKAD